jgi:hypothetical protein
MVDCFGSYKKKGCKFKDYDKKIKAIDSEISSLTSALTHSTTSEATNILSKISSLYSERDGIKEKCASRWICSEWSRNPLNTKSFMFRFYLGWFIFQLVLIPIFNYNRLSELNIWNFSGTITFCCVWFVISYFGYRQKKSIDKRILKLVAEEI